MGEREEIYTETYRDIDIYYVPDEGIFRFVVAGTSYERGKRYEVYSAIQTLIEIQEAEAEGLPEEEIKEKPEEILITDTTEIAEVTGIILPSLPWYVAWLQPVLNYMGSLTEAVVNFMAPIFRPIGQLADHMVDLPKNLVTNLVKNVGRVMEGGRSSGIQIALQTMTDATGETPGWVEDLREQVEGMIGTIMTGYVEAMDVETWEKSPLGGENAIKALVEIKGKVLSAAIVNFVIHAIVESGSMGQFEWVKDLDPLVTSKLGLDAVIERATMLPLEKAILIPAEQEYFTKYPTTIPTYSDLINMVVKEVIDLKRFKAEMLKYGFREEWSQFIWDAHFRAPDWTQLLQAFYRGAITKEELDSFKVLVDLDPRYDVVWNSLIEVIPPYSEIVNLRVKEVIGEEEFNKYLQWHGFDPAWGKRIWDGHFLPPSLGDILTAWRRGLIDEDRVDELMIIVDLDPRFKEVFDTRKYVDPSPTMGRFMFETGAIDEERLRDIIDRAGYTDEDGASIVDMLTGYQERIFRRRYLIALQTGVIHEAFTHEDLTKAVTEAGYRKEVAEWMIKTADVRKAIRAARVTGPKEKILTLGDLKKAFELDKISADDYRTRLLTRGYEIGDVDLMVTLMESKKVTEEAGGRKISLSQSELLNAWRYGEITEDHLNVELQLRGLALDEVEILINTKKAQWGLG